VDNKQFVSENFVIPQILETKQFRLRMLSVDDVEKDYEAVMETQARFHSMGYDWPREGFTIEENLADLKQHQQEFLNRDAFAYTVVSLDESRILGVYILILLKLMALTRLYGCGCGKVSTTKDLIQFCLGK